MSSPERLTRANTEADLMNSLMDFLSPQDGEVITLGQVTKSRARNSHFDVMLIKQRSEGDATLRIVGSQLTTEKRLSNTAEELGSMLRLNIYRTEEEERLALIRKKIFAIKKEAKKALSKTT